MSTYQMEIDSLKSGKCIPQSSKLLPFHPFIDLDGILRVGGRLSEAVLAYSKRHPILFPGDHASVKLLIVSEHLCWLHAAPTLVAASLLRRFCIMGGRRAICLVIRSCVKCRREFAMNTTTSWTISDRSFESRYCFWTCRYLLCRPYSDKKWPC